MLKLHYPELKALIIRRETQVRSAPSPLKDIQHLDRCMQRTQTTHHVNSIARGLIIDQNPA